MVLPTKLSESKDKLTQAPNIKDKNKKLKIKPLRTQKKKPEHKITLKNNKDILADLEKNKTKEKSESNPKLTKVIFHGENYENTKSTIDFMKYNFDYSQIRTVCCWCNFTDCKSAGFLDSVCYICKINIR